MVISYFPSPFPMAKRIVRTRKALSFLYEIPGEEFVEITKCVSCTPDIREYTTDLVVDKHPEYPDIPPSVWTVILAIKSSNGDISETVEPKNGAGSLKNPGLVLVDWRIRWAGDQEDDIDENLRADCHWHLWPDGFQQGTYESPSFLVDDHDDGENKRHYVLDRAAWVMVSLTFTVPKTITNRILETLYESTLLTDCKLVCSGREFPAHRAILAAHSPVFAAMFQNDMKEKSSGICTIKDVCADVMDALLQFVYTKELTKTDGKLEGLWTAADKYDMPELKQECERRMVESVADDNAFEYLCFAKKRGLKRLKVEAAKIISQESL